MDIDDGTEPHSDEPHLLGFINADIVGSQHYSGTISGRQMVGLLRDPLNQFDPNAIKVLNTHSLQVGHIERSVAAVLSPLIDSELIIVEAIVPNSRSKSNRFRFPCQIHIFTQISFFPIVRDHIIGAGLQLISHNDPSFTLSESKAVQETKASIRFKNDEEIFRHWEEILSSKGRDYDAIEPPREMIKTELLTHQKEGLGWLVNRENSDDLPPFWEEREGEFVNMLTNYRTDNRPEPLRGGILADDMGLGKTLTLLSLIAIDKKCGFGNGDDAKERRMIKDVGSCDELVTNATLVVCPPSVLSTWTEQLVQHTVQGSLKTHMYYGNYRTRDPDELKKYDLVFTTYATLSSEANVDKAPAKKLEWRRIILDEAHTIKNHDAQQTKAVISLNAKRRWAVTGTPTQNSWLDLYSLLAFLHFEPFSIRRYWLRFLQRPFHIRLESGRSRLEVVMAAISLRRTKDIGLPCLPPKTIEIHYVELDSEERELYDHVHEVSRNTMSSYIGNDGVVRHYAAMLSMIQRLCLVCTDMALCPKDLNGSLSLSNNITDISKNPELMEKLVEMGEDLGCPICLSLSMDMVITRCAHPFCRDCIMRALDCCNSRCPMCRRLLKESDLFSARKESFWPDSSAPSSSSATKASSKTSALLKLLVESRDQNPDVKSVVFSQFNKILSLLEGHLKAAGFKTLRLDGSLDAKTRTKVIEQFQSGGRDGATVLLASLRASSAGINLTAASRVYLMDPWWNPAVEEQAMDRVHRIGQKEAVKIVRFIAQNSIEERMLELHEKKKKEVAEKTLQRYTDFGMGMGMKEISFLMKI